MNIVVFGAQGVLGEAVCRALERQGHRVRRAARRNADLAVDFRFDLNAATLRAAVQGMDIVVNATGILIEREGDTWDNVHHVAVDALAAACEAERVARIVHVSALGVDTGLGGGYMRSKLAGEKALARRGVDYAIVRPSLLVDAGCASTRLFRALCALPIIALPGLRDPGGSRIAPVQVTDVADCIAAIVAHPKALRRVIELEGPERLTYRAMLERLRAAQGRGRALWVPLPWWLVRATAWLALAWPQRVISPDTVRMLRASCEGRSETTRWLPREPLPLDARLSAQASAVVGIA